MHGRLSAALVCALTLAVPAQKPVVLDGHKDHVYSVACNPKGTLLASASADNTATVRDLKTDKILFTVEHKGPVYCVTFSPDGALLATSGGDKVVKLWDAATGKEVRTLAGHKGPVHSLAFAPDGKTLLSCSGEPAAEGRLWNVRDGALQSELKGPVRPQYGTAINDRWVVVAGGDKVIRVWDRKKPNGGPGPSRATPVMSTASASRPTGNSSPRPARTRPSACGTWSPASCAHLQGRPRPGLRGGLLSRRQAPGGRGG